MHSKRWEILSNKLKVKSSKLKIKDLVRVILQNRGLRTKKEIEEFLNPKLEDVTTKSVGIDQRELQKAIKRIQRAIKNQEQIIVFGDYDVDGVCGTAILWETLNSLGAKVLPYIPHRIEEGYGLSVKGIENILPLGVPLGVKPLKGFNPSEPSEVNPSEVKIIITVDNGIVAHKAVQYANEQDIDVIITDHHVPPAGGTKKLPDAYAIVHTTKLCGAGVAYLLAQNIKYQISNIKYDKEGDNHLELVALATVADLVPLIGANRTLLKFGLEQLRTTKRVGLIELFKEAGIDQSLIDVYSIGHVIAPRLNAMGRIEHGMDALRLLCTKSQDRARELAYTLGLTNRERQQMTEETALHAGAQIRNSKFEIRNLLFIGNEKYQQGVIGLVAGKLVEEFYRPSIVVSVGEKYSKASARSVAGFNIIEFIREAKEFLVDAGGHPMAAGFTVETQKLRVLQNFLEEKAEKLLNGELLTRSLRVDCELSLQDVAPDLYAEIQNLAPFGMGNPEPTFVARGVVIEDMRAVGSEGRHLKLRLAQPKFEIRNSKFEIDAIAFGMGDRVSELHVGDKVDIAYTIAEDRWLARSELGENGKKRLQLKIKDIRRTSAH